MIIITGGCGFIGSNLAHKLYERGFSLLIVDNPVDGDKLLNISRLPLYNFYNKHEFLSKIKEKSSEFDDCQAIIHLGACSSTMEQDGNYLITNNYHYSRHILDFCKDKNIPFIYASSASVYGLGENGFSVQDSPMNPINPYAYSKSLFDYHVLNALNHSHTFYPQIVGLRFFNVYGPNESHKKNMCSPVHAFYIKALQEKCISLFDGHGTFSPTDYRRDFIHVADCIDIIMWFLERSHISGIFNCGTGSPVSFVDIANVIKDLMEHPVSIKYVPFPDRLRNKYQSFTCANLNCLESVNYKKKSRDIFSGISSFIQSFSF